MIENINVGLNANDGLGDKLRDAFIIVNNNFASIQDVLSGTGSFTISQIQGLQTALDNINNQLVYIPSLQSDINDINSIIYTINQTLNNQNISIADLYTEITNLQQQIYTKIGDAPIDGNQYVRINGTWSSIATIVGPTGATGPQGIQGVTGPTGPANPIVSGYFTPDANTLTLVDSLGGEVIIDNEINIIEKNLAEILSLIADRKLIRGVTYKISEVDKKLYEDDANDKGNTIYLLALEDNRLDTFGTGIFYTPKYKDFTIWKSTETYSADQRVIWGGYVWRNKNGNTGSTLSDYLLDSSEWSLIAFDNESYNLAFDKIKYDIINDKIVYRNEKNINEVSFNFEELKKIWLETGDYCPIRAFQWGKGFSYNEDKGRLEGIGNQRIYNSLNRNINFRGISQNNILLNNQSFIYDLETISTNTVVSDIQLDNGSKITKVDLLNDCNLQYIKLDNQSYIYNIDLQEGSSITNLDMNNMSFILQLSLINTKFDKYTLNNASYIDTCVVTNAYNYNMLYDNNASQVGTNNFIDPDYYYQINTTIKNTQITSVDEDQNGWFFLGDLPDSGTSNLVGRDGLNRLVDVSVAGYVPYVGATGDVDLGSFGLTATSLQFTGLTNSGRLTWNDTDGTADLTLKGGNVTLQIGQEQLVRVVNKTGSDLLQSNFQAVRISGAQGNRLKVDLALATSDALSAETIGLVTETILNNQEGFVTISGLVRDINTTGGSMGETWNDGDILYLSPAVAGKITNIKPSAPNHLVVIGYVVRAHVTQGSIFVKVNNGYELDELHNVLISGTPSNGEVLTYDVYDNVWRNEKPLNDIQIRRTGITIYDDMTSSGNGTSPFLKSIFHSGTWGTSVLFNENNMGIINVSSTTASTNGGGSILLVNSGLARSLTITPGLQFDIIFYQVNTSTIKTRVGFIYGTNNALAPTDGLYFELDGLVASAYSANTSVRSSSATYSVPEATYSHYRIKMVSSSLATFEIYNMAGALLWTTNLTTNIPSVGTGTQPGFISHNSAALSQTIAYVDYISATYPAMNRGALT